ncbi:hypothetical protein BDP27DRAFT_428035 [Rhodocollybia butyracea]|uniref:Uncharacterized protein n=1 Tax=Rhodocollybia butyracea TaxID=206335 RepID=A0A9P5UAT4_9AGAR|nr:hypothetical protein BDP27DRAFT_428035 [Rhodocollybia butyracea]
MDSASNSSSTSSERSPKLRHSAHSSMSLTSGSSLLDDQDEDVRIAVKALGDMRNGNIGSGKGKGRNRISTSTTPALSVSTSTTPATSIRSPTLSIPREAQVEQDFVSRVAHIPLVNGALKMYEQGKASSRVVKYGAEIMESGVKTISRPVIDRLPTGQLDDFACRQLDRVSCVPCCLIIYFLPLSVSLVLRVLVLVHLQYLTDQLLCPFCIAFH